MEKLNIRLAARCEAAGRPNNEDNFQVDSDPYTGNWQFKKDEVFPLGNLGALLLVCDGMGGMNAGEVASKIAVDTVKYRFSIDSLSNIVQYVDEQRCDFIRHVIQEADTNIKKESSADIAKRGMGSTIVLAWLLEGKAYVGWCGDSRAYKYNPNHGLVQLSHDHSYVQELVDSGKLSPELAFDHPNSNVITRSLGDPRGAAQPDVKCFSLEENDIILLCSDGLCGVLRDHEMEQLIAGHQNSMVACLDALWEAARNAGWHDNVTIELAQVMPKHAKPQDIPVLEHKPTEKSIVKPNYKNKKYLKIGLAVLTAVLVVLAIVWACLKYLGEKKENPSASDLCSEYIVFVEQYKNMNPFEPKGEIEEIKSYINAIKECDSLSNNVLSITNSHLDKIKSAEMTEEEMGAVPEQLNEIINDLKNNKK